MPVILLSQPEKDFDLEKTKNSGYSHERADTKKHISQESRKYLLQKGDFTKVSKDINRIEKNRLNNNVTNSTYLLGKNDNTMDMNISNPRVDGNYFKFEIQIRRTNTWESGLLENALGNVDFYFDRNADAFTGTPSYENLHTDLTGDNYTCTAQVNADKLQFKIEYSFQDMNFLTPILNVYETVCTMVWEIADFSEDSGIIWDQLNTGALTAANNAINLTYYGNGDITLPVELSSFTAQYLNEQAQLYWQTQTENDNLGWNVYRNSESDFTSAIRINDEFIPGHGTTAQPQDYVYEDTNGQFESGDDYWYWLESIDYSGKVHHYDRVAIIHISEGQDPEPQIAVPIKYGLQYGPNPFNSNLTISYMLRKTDMVRVEIYNMCGQLLAEFDEGQRTADRKYNLKWDGKDLYGRDISSGVLLIKLITSEGSETKKAILLR